MTYTLEPLGYLDSCFSEKFGVPRQSRLAAKATAQLALVPPYNRADCVAGLEGVSHLWLSFIFHQSLDQGWKPKVRPPRLGGNKKQGVFATRSPFRPNHLGLSVVRLERIEVAEPQVVLHLSGVDLVAGTPIVDIKPYVPYVDAVPEAVNAFADHPPLRHPVVFSAQAQAFCAAQSQYGDLQGLLTEVLQQDPRPAYQPVDGDRLYKMALWDMEVTWCCRLEAGEKLMEVVEIGEGM